MMESYERFNYGLRPAKHIERKMLAEAMRSLFVFSPLSSYRYIGFGSIYFSDFILFHKLLGIDDMISIESKIKDRERFIFNKPYKCINILFGLSHKILLDLTWDKRSMVWLDYDGNLDQNSLTDIKFLTSEISSGSIIIFTFPVRADQIPEEGSDEPTPIDRLKERVGSEFIPFDLKDEDLMGWGTAKTYRRIITTHINNTLRERNGSLSPEKQFKYKQLFNFHYADGMKMLTVGGLIYSESERHLMEGCRFDNLPFIRTDDSPYLIQVPNLTYREIRHLDAQLPCNPTELQGAAISQGDLQKYLQIYRYYPTYAETEI